MYEKTSDTITVAWVAYTFPTLFYSRSPENFRCDATRRKHLKSTLGLSILFQTNADVDAAADDT